MEPFFERLLQKLQNRYPVTARSLELRERLTPLLFCPHPIRLPDSLRTQAQDIVSAFFRLRNNDIWKTRLEKLTPTFPDPGNFSALMSFDFHVDEDGRLRLIEVNTNASMALMADLAHETHGLPNVFSVDFRKEIVETFHAEFAFAYPDGRKLKRIAIVDENPQEQRLFAEFVMYRELFEQAGLEAFIADVDPLGFENGHLLLEGKPIDLVYNRHTDFYLESHASKALRDAVKNQAACVSPHPHEYRLLADKERLLELSQAGALDALQLSDQDKEIILRTLIRTLDVQEFENPDELWVERKKWFFKTKRSFGGKAAYRGSSIGRTAFAHVISGPYVAQEYVPPGLIRLPSLQGEDEFKYDLRFFVYRDTIQLACARLYKGQMTNSSTPGGGIAVIEWE